MTLRLTRRRPLCGFRALIFDPASFTKVKAMTEDTGTYLIPAIKKLPGLAGWQKRRRLFDGLHGPRKPLGKRRPWRNRWDSSRK